jgi:hypothetical protein
VSQWVADLETARGFGVPTLEATGPVKANGFTGMILPRVEGATGDPLYEGARDGKRIYIDSEDGSSIESPAIPVDAVASMVQRYKDYAHPEITNSDLDAIELGMKKARDKGYAIAAGHLEIDSSGHVRVPYVKKPKDRVLDNTFDDPDHLPIPSNPWRYRSPYLNGIIGEEEKVIASVRGELGNVKAVATVLRELNIETDPAKANALAAELLSKLADPKTHAVEAPLGSEYDWAVQKLAGELHPSKWVYGQDPKATALANYKDDALVRGALAVIVREKSAGILQRMPE